MTPSSQDLARRFPALAKHAHSADLDAIRSGLTVRQLRPGEHLVDEGSPSDRVFLLWQGNLEATVSHGADLVVTGEFGPGAILGEVSLLDPGPSSTTVIASEPATVLVLTREAFEQLTRDHPRAAVAIMHALARLLCHRVRTATDWLEELRGHAPAPRQSALISALRALLGLRRYG